MSQKWMSFLVVCVVVCGVLDALPIDSQLSPVAQSLEAQENALNIQPSSDGGQIVREKRTIGFLRQAFPTLSQIIDRKIQAITRLLFRLIGRLVLRGAAGGGGGGGGTDSDSSGGDNGRRISITLPTFPPSADEDADEDSTDSDGTGTESSSDSTTTTTEASDSDNTVSESKVVPVLVRKARQVQTAEEEDQSAEATGDNELSSSAEETDDSDSAESGETPEDSRDKRLVNFNLGGGSGGSGGGSGNFLFDIIRLVAGSGTTQSEDEASNAPLDDGNATVTGKDDGYSAGVPGPLTRLFVIANRGIANLIQDLILRLAQTSERIVNFKARLITSII